jgi:2-oxoglutarate dehydrogenase E2 component (dihydrolipoamide succinyltransferase)
MGDSISEGVIESYVKSKLDYCTYPVFCVVDVGEFAAADEVIARIETDKVTVDILATHSGVITKYFAEEGDVVEVGADFAEVDTDAKAGAAPTPVAEAPKAAPVESAPTPAPVKQVSNCPKAI